MKLGPDARGSLFIQLTNFPDHYLVIIITDERFKYALITTKDAKGAMIPTMTLEDIAWIDSERIHQTAAKANAKANVSLKLKQPAVGHREERNYSGLVESCRSHACG